MVFRRAAEVAKHLDTFRGKQIVEVNPGTTGIEDLPHARRLSALTMVRITFNESGHTRAGCAVAAAARGGAHVAACARRAPTVPGTAQGALRCWEDNRENAENEPTRVCILHMVLGVVGAT